MANIIKQIKLPNNSVPYDIFDADALRKYHDLEINWEKKTDFIPSQGEIIVYDRETFANGLIMPNTVADGEGNSLLSSGRTTPFDYERFKIGDGVKNVNDLPFTVAPITNNEIDDVCGTSLGEIISSIGYSTGTITAQFYEFTSFSGQGGTGTAVGNTFTLNYTKIGNIINIYGTVNGGNFSTTDSNSGIGIKFSNFAFTPLHNGENTMAGSVGSTGLFSAYLQYMYINNNSYIMCVDNPYFVIADAAQRNVTKYPAGVKFLGGYVNFSIPIA